jgi:hypothetical protein
MCVFCCVLLSPGQLVLKRIPGIFPRPPTSSSELSVQSGSWHLLLSSSFKAVCSHGVALLLIEDAYDWIQHTVTRQSSHVPHERFSLHSHAHHAVLPVAPLQLYSHNVASREKIKLEVQGSRLACFRRNKSRYFERTNHEFFGSRLGVPLVYSVNASETTPNTCTLPPSSLLSFTAHFTAPHPAGKPRSPRAHAH